MNKGKVKWFDGRKGFGFITGEDGVDRFVHVSNIEKGRTKIYLNKDDVINFEVGESQGKEAAVNVVLCE